MKCRNIQELLYEYVTGRLSLEHRRVVEKHLKKCSKCTEALEEMRTTVQLLDCAKPAKAPRGFTEKVMQQIDDTAGSPVIAAEDTQEYIVTSPVASFADSRQSPAETDHARARIRDKAGSGKRAFYRHPACRYVLPGVAAAVVILTVAAVLRYGPHPDRPVPVSWIPEQFQEPYPELIGGEGEKQQISAGCAEAAALYNRSLSTERVSQKETLLKDALDCACEQKPILAKIRNNLADCYQQQGKELMAIREYKQAITLDGSLPRPYIGLGELYKNKGENKKAAEYYKKALSLLEDEQQKNRIRKKRQKLKQGGADPQ